MATSLATAFTMSEKPHIVLIPGAWHTGACYHIIIPLLEDAGYATTALTLPSVGVVMHSYGGIPGSDAMKGLGRAERSGKGLKGGVVALVYICAWMLPEGKCVADYPRSIPNKTRLRFEVLKSFCSSPKSAVPSA
jgi:hypothetical protein